VKTIDCPLLGRRPVSEFAISGVLTPEPAELGAHTPGQWVYARNSVPLTREEWWYHTPSQLWFVVRRDTGSDDITAVRLAHE